MGLLVKHIQNHAGGRKSFRRQIPNELRNLIGKTQIRVSLGYRDSPGFLSRYEAAAAEYDREVALARRKLEGAFDRLTPELIDYLVRSMKADHLETDDEVRWLPRSSERKRVARDRHRMDSEEGLKEAVELRALGDIGTIMAQWSETAENHAHLMDFTVDQAAPEFTDYVRAFHDAAIDVWSSILKRLDGEDIPTPPEPERPMKCRVKAPKGPAVPIMATYDTYALASGMTVRVRNEWRTSMQRLVDHVGHDDAAGLTADDLRGWRNALLQETVRGGGPRSPVTVRNKYIRPVKAMLEWAVQEGKLPTNAADKVTVTVPRAITLRQKDFTAEEAKAILAATLQPPPARMTEGHRLARRWIPWLCAYSGARVGEFAQLRAEDVKAAGGIWYCNITPDAGTVKTGEAREVPLHAHLIEQGFLDIVKAKGTGPLFYDPGQQRVANEGNRHIDKIGERLGQWVRNDVGITDRAIKPNHAWRHTFKTLAADVGIGERIADAIQGHAPNTVGGTYGTVSLKAKATAMAVFPRFEVPGSGQ